MSQSTQVAPKVLSFRNANFALVILSIVLNIAIQLTTRETSHEQFGLFGMSILLGIEAFLFYLFIVYPSVAYDPKTEKSRVLFLFVLSTLFVPALPINHLSQVISIVILWLGSYGIYFNVFKGKIARLQEDE